MVVPEGLSTGLPAIVSDRVGAKMIFERHPGAGWVVPFGVGPLAERMLSLALEPSRIGPASRDALAAAKDWTWEAYRRRVQNVICSIIAKGATRRSPGRAAA
jgi:glycosyltransferase involved in cell wall biosynthesis